jgi:hypothetical protein
MGFRVFSVVLWLFSAAFVSLLLVAYLSRPLAAYTPEHATAVAILALFAWSLLELLTKAWQVRAEHHGVGQFQMLFAKAEAGDYSARPYNLKDPRAIRRVNHIIECWKPDISKLHDAVPAVASLDATILAGSYGPLNVYAWVLPVLGFIGTATGMAAAIGGFKVALAQARGNLDVLVNTLANQVIPGLAGAFHITILALGASLVVYLCTSALRDWDQEALNKLDRLCVVMLSRIPLPASPEGEKIVLAINSISSQLEGILKTPASLEQAATAIAAAADRLVAVSREMEASLSAPYTVTIERGKRSQLPARAPSIDGNARTL